MYRYLQTNRKITDNIRREAGLSKSQATAIETELKLNEPNNQSKRKKSDYSFEDRIKIGDYARLYGRGAAEKKI